MATRKEVIEDISFDLGVIIRKFENDLENLKHLKNVVDTWESSGEYEGELQFKISETLLGLTNNSNWIAYAGSAIRKAGA